MNSNRTPSEEFALGQWLSEYPEDAEYQDILDHILGEFDGDEILVWGVLMEYPPQKIVEIIENTKYNFEEIVNEYYTPKEQN